MMVGWRVGRIASVTGTSEQAKKGQIDVSLWVGKCGKGVIKHEKSPGYKDKAVWDKFIKEGAHPTDPVPRSPSTSTEEFDDHIPF